jgi:hypothetical protein
MDADVRRRLEDYSLAVVPAGAGSDKATWHVAGSPRILNHDSHSLIVGNSDRRGAAEGRHRSPWRGDGAGGTCLGGQTGGGTLNRARGRTDTQHDPGLQYPPKHSQGLRP